MQLHLQVATRRTDRTSESDNVHFINLDMQGHSKEKFLEWRKRTPKYCNQTPISPTEQVKKCSRFFFTDLNRQNRQERFKKS